MVSLDHFVIYLYHYLMVHDIVISIIISLGHYIQIYRITNYNIWSPQN